MNISQQNKKNIEHEDFEMKEGENPNAHVKTEIIRGIEIIPESEMIKCMVKYSPGKTRHIMSLSLLFSLLGLMIIFGVLHVVVEKEMIDRLENFCMYSLSIMGSLTGTAVGFFFGREFHERNYPWKKEKKNSS